MDTLSGREFTEMLDPVSTPCVSIYLPTRIGGLEMRHDVLRLKNLLKEAADQLQNDATFQGDHRKLFGPVEKLLTDKEFWKHCNEGLAILLSSDNFRSYRLPASFAESVTVSEKYYLRPLLPAIESNLSAYLLALSQERVRLYRVLEHSIEEDQAPNLPHNMGEALNYSAAERGAQVHSSGQPGRGKQAVVFHGHGGKPDAKKQDLKSFCAVIDRALCRYLRKERDPLVLACVEYLEPIYRDVTKYPQLIEEFVQGSPNQLTEKELHKRSWALLEPTLNGPRQKAIQDVHERMGSKDFTNDVYRILPAAHEGRVDYLLLDESRKLWGSYQAKYQVVDVHDTASPGDEDLLELAAVETLRHRGQVYQLPAAQLPTPAPLAAMLRYS